MKLGDLAKKILSPFVKGTKYENCDDCEERRLKWNSFSDRVVAFVNKIFCPCYWRKKFK